MKADKHKVNLIGFFNIINFVMFAAIAAGMILFGITFVQARTPGVSAENVAIYTKWYGNFWFASLMCYIIMAITTLSCGISIQCIRWQAEWTRLHKSAYGILIIITSFLLIGPFMIWGFCVKAKTDFKYRPLQEIIVPTDRKLEKAVKMVAQQGSIIPQQPQVMGSQLALALPSAPGTQFNRPMGFNANPYQQPQQSFYQQQSFQNPYQQPQQSFYQQPNNPAFNFQSQNQFYQQPIQNPPGFNFQEDNMQTTEVRQNMEEITVQNPSDFSKYFGQKN